MLGDIIFSKKTRTAFTPQRYIAVVDVKHSLKYESNLTKNRNGSIIYQLPEYFP